MNHGHVIPNADGTRARCGGPMLCKDCQRELQGIQMSQRTPFAKASDQMRLAAYELHSHHDLRSLIEVHKVAIAALLTGIAEIDRLNAELQAARMAHSNADTPYG